MPCIRLVIAALLAVSGASGVALVEFRGPLFVRDPPAVLELSNSTGASLDCWVSSSTPVTIRWIDAHGNDVVHIPGVRHILSNGSLILPPFRSDFYRADVHHSQYRCVATNTFGSIVSPSVVVRTAVVSSYKVYVADAHTLLGNSALLSCLLPAELNWALQITHWMAGSHLISTQDTPQPDSKYAVINGNLHVTNVQLEDTRLSYRCFTKNRLDGQQASSPSGKIVITTRDAMTSGPDLTVSGPQLNQPPLTVVHSQLGHDVLLPCSVQGLPVPKVRWMKVSSSGSATALISDHRRIASSSSGGGSSSGWLLLRQLTGEDAGRYRCQAANIHGQIEADVQLHVSGSYHVNVEPKQQMVSVGHPAELSCNISSKGYLPHPAISWVHNGADVAPSGGSSKYYLPQPHVLRINQAGRSDAGVYQCLVRVPATGLEVQAAAELIVQEEASRLTSVFSEQTVQPGRSVYLHCFATGNPSTGAAAASISWSVDSLMMPYTSGRISVWSNKIDEHTLKSYLNISSVQVEDGGLYCCSVNEEQAPTKHQRWPSTTRQHCARLNVYGMAFIRWTTNRTAVSGEDHYLDCPFAGYPILSITWYRHGQLLQESDKYQQFTNGTLRIASIDPNADAGEYTCLVRGASSSTAKRALYVDIVRPPVIEPFTFPSLVQDSGRTQVTCSISAGDLPMEITWMKDGRPIGHQLNVETQTGEFHSLLIFKKLRGEHSGIYTCTARNLAATASHSATLLVQVTPKWMVEPQDVAALENSAAKIPCQVHGMPPPSVVWYKIDGESQHMIHPASGKMSIQSDGSLLLSRVSKSDEGIFMCRAHNNIGSAISKSVRVTVNAGARVRVQPNESTLPSGSEAWLRCEVSGDLPLTVHWKKGNRIIESSHRFQLRPKSMAGGQQQSPLATHPTPRGLELNISRVAFDDSGTYTCEAANSFGSDSAQVQLMVQELPRAPRDVQIINVMSRTVELQWREESAARESVGPAVASPLEFLIELSRSAGGPKSSLVNQTVDKGRTFAVVANLLPFTDYQVRVYAINYAGMGPPSEPLRFHTLEEAPSGQPRYVLAEAKSSRSVLVSWLAPTEDTWNGLLVTYVVQCHEKSPSRHLIQRSVAAVSSDQLIDSLSNIRRQTILEPLRPATAYSISVRALSRVGSGPESETIVVNTPEAAPSASPMNVNCVALSSDAIQVAWSPPPGDHHNGLLQGFRIFYKPLGGQQQSTSSEFYNPDSFRVDSKRVGNVADSILHGLQAYRNYSIQISAINRAGNGPPSSPINCQTDENVAGTPQDFKVLSLSATSILVSWRRPTPSSGRVTHYTVSVKDNATQDRKVFVVKEGDRGSGDGHVTYELRDLVENRYYQIYVTASTRVGESRPSRHLSAAPVSKSAAKIVEFSRNVYSEKHANIVLPCTAVGVNPVDKMWTLGGKSLALHSSISYQWGKENALQLLDVNSDYEGDYACAVQNAFGRDSIVYSVSVLQAPDPPLLSVVSTSGTSMTLSWTKPTNKLPVLELIVHYRQVMADARYQSKSVDANEDGTVLEDLQCGAQYELQIQARNKVGTGPKSAVLRALTRGSGPMTPDTDRLFSSVQNVPTSLILHADHWPSGGCRINYIQVEKRGPLHAGHDADQQGPVWKVLAASLNPDEQPMYKIHDFAVDDVHQLKLTAYSDAGTLTTFYDVQRLSQKNGSHFQVRMAVPPGGSSVTYEVMIIIVCMSVSGLMLMFSVGAIVYVLQKRRQYRAASRGQDKSEYSLRTITERMEDHQSNGRPLLPDESSTYSLRKQLHSAHLDYDDDDITPYATFTLKPICGPMDTNRSLMSVPSRGPDSHSSNSIEADLYGHHPTLPCMYQTHLNRHLNRSPVPPYRHSDTDRSDSTMYSDTYGKSIGSRKRSQRLTQCEVLRPPSHFSDLHPSDNDFVKIRF